MDPQQHPHELTRRERRLLRKLAEKKSQESSSRSRTLKRWAIWFFIGGAVIGLLTWWAMAQKPLPEGDVVARRGLHWHPELTIVVKGQTQDIEANIGIGAAHNPIHTHDSSGIIHLEFEGLVTKDDLRLGKFFKEWGRTFTSTCILDKCNGPDGQVKMTVNGQANTEFDQYIMRDKDKIEIRFE